ncbi:putative Na+/H+ antiporter NhaD and related arsenite permeases [Deinococcus aerius]|uniref:Putative Na+/H+ antiporter NhaD and related arsenite permeases n=1 Tax=Deinococcus aerius TaxID=200253 RepID=A0A2I9DY99_9DEIO|nr:SLC13 family permease [Deinococcus aerius]GBF08267.1 putative Na+/H+ antiporter NhaD and related arsenite permeases [Deinococcus aerius]
MPETEHHTLLDVLGLHLSDGTLTILAVALFVLTYVMILLEKYVHRTVAALLGACAVMVLGLLTPEQAWDSIDFNTIFLLFGMMNIVNVLSHSGFFDLVARRAMLFTRGDARPRPVDLQPAHRRLQRLSRQRDHRAVHGPCRRDRRDPARPEAAAVLDRGRAGEQHRRHGDSGR